ncbi:hypothetical protein CALVIDRAFT_563353 [Calocera viscosa TUFC12733]|uniref:Uncharacterized protein n=1 Tax=Calocera viscosa (strain TUFC12733) TaxID=1330018 RepID=A0A167MXC9_CALVF|nr:hypothetical protein CALVIDRAFT_563353 [Calocera viscosa TUFC12733]
MAPSISSSVVRDRIGLDLSERAACRYLHRAGLPRDTLQRLFCKGPRAIQRAISNETTQGAPRDFGDDALHIPERFKRRGDEGLADFERRIMELAEEAQEQARRARDGARVGPAFPPPMAARPNMSAGMSGSATADSQSQREVEGSGMDVRRGNGSTALVEHHQEDDADGSEVVCISRLPPQTAIRTEELLKRQARPPIESTRVVDSDDESDSPQPEPVSPAKRPRQSDEATPASEPFGKVARIAKTSPGAYQPPKAEPILYFPGAGASAYVSPPLSPAIENERLSPLRWPQSEPGPSRLAGNLEDIMQSRPAQETAARPSPSDSASTIPTSALHGWLRTIRLGHRVALLNEVGFETLQDARDAANFSHDTRIRMFTTLEENGMTKFETWRLQDGLEKLKVDA